MFRAGFARTIPAARQLIRHGHILINARKVDIPSVRVRVGDRIALRERSRELDVVATSLADPVQTPQWLVVDAVNKAIEIRGTPDSSSMLLAIDTRLIIEFYAQ